MGAIDRVLIGGGVAVFGGISAGFVATDVAQAKDKVEIKKGVAIAEVVFASSLTLLSNVAPVVIASTPDAEEAVIVAPFSILSSSLMAHGCLTLATDRIKPDLIPIIALMTGTNTALSTMAIGRLFSGKLAPRSWGIAATALTLPQVVGSAFAAGMSVDDRAAWLGALGWSSALFLHGVASIIWGKQRAPPHVSAPPEAPQSPPLQVPERPESPADGRAPKAKLILPSSLRVSPQPISPATWGELRSVSPGVVLSGEWL